MALNPFKEKGYVRVGNEIFSPIKKGGSAPSQAIKTPASPIPAIKLHDLEPMVELGGQRFVIKHEPVAAPRMTRQDKWLNPRRPCVQRYFDYRDVVQRSVGDLPTVPHTIMFTFYFPMPDSWSKKKKAEMDGARHRQRPDSDNLMKAIMDALLVQDGGVSDTATSKRWCMAGEERIELEIFT